jgi:hypothetical protein
MGAVPLTSPIAKTNSADTGHPLQTMNSTGCVFGESASQAILADSDPSAALDRPCGRNTEHGRSFAAILNGAIHSATLWASAWQELAY